MEQMNNGYEQNMERSSVNVQKIIERIHERWPDLQFEVKDLPNEFSIEVAGVDRVRHFTKVDPFVVIENGVAHEVPLEVAVLATILAPRAESIADALRETNDIARGVAEKIETGQN
jgi:hypothetical protein